MFLMMSSFARTWRNMEMGYSGRISRYMLFRVFWPSIEEIVSPMKYHIVCKFHTRWNCILAESLHNIYLFSKNLSYSSCKLFWEKYVLFLNLSAKLDYFASDICLVLYRHEWYWVLVECFLFCFIFQIPWCGRQVWLLRVYFWCITRIAEAVIIANR